MHLPKWPKIRRTKNIDLGLNRILELLARLGNPHQNLPPTIHIAGTNGKGSTLAYLESIFQAAEYKVHKYTSPHLVQFNERINLANYPISDIYLTELLEECEKAANIEPEIDVTFFEGITVAAFLAFSRIKADILLLETGMGGRLDATNVIENPILTLISSISMDHQQFLGNKIEDIAFEKAGIIKNGAPIIVSKQEKSVTKVIEDKAMSFPDSPVILFEKHFDFKENDNSFKFLFSQNELNLPKPKLIGSHQLENASLAIAAIYQQNILKISKQDIIDGLKNVSWRGRLEKIDNGTLYNKLDGNYELYLDGGHNAKAAELISKWVKKDNQEKISNKDHRPDTYFICAMLKDKEIKSFFKNIAQIADFVITIAIDKTPDAQKPAIIAKIADNNGIKSVYSDNFEQAFEYITTIHEEKHQIIQGNFLKKLLIKKKNNVPARIIICGSLHLVGEFISENEGFLEEQRITF